jgi:hypothetical protein
MNNAEKRTQQARERLCTIHGFHSEWVKRPGDLGDWWACLKCHPEWAAGSGDH